MKTKTKKTKIARTPTAWDASTGQFKMTTSNGAEICIAADGPQVAEFYTCDITGRTTAMRLNKADLSGLQDLLLSVSLAQEFGNDEAVRLKTFGETASAEERRKAIRILLAGAYEKISEELAEAE